MAYRLVSQSNDASTHQAPRNKVQPECDSYPNEKQTQAYRMLDPIGDVSDVSGLVPCLMGFFSSGKIVHVCALLASG